MVTDFSFVAILSMAIGFSALGLSFYILHTQDKTNKKLEKNTELLTGQIKEQRQYYSDIFLIGAHRSAFNFKNAIDLYEKIYVTQEMPELSTYEETLAIHYNNCTIDFLPKFDQELLVRVFGNNLALKHHRLTNKSRVSETYLRRPDNRPVFISLFKEYMYNLIELKDAFLPYCHDHIKQEDEKRKDDYDLIKKIWEEREER